MKRWNLDDRPPLNELWNGRSAFRLSNGLVETVVLPGGGHIVEFRFTAASGYPDQNTIWQPSWPTADPNTDEYASLVPQYGDANTGPHLAAYAGHSLCLDCFGVPSEEEARNGIPLHGEAAVTHWEYANEGECNANAFAELPISGLRVARKFRLLFGESVLRVDEQVNNLRDTSRDLHWVQHATLGQPFLSPSVSTINASAKRGKTWPYGYDGHELLPAGTEFSWPNVPAINGETIDLRIPFSRTGRGYIVGTEQDRARKFSFIAAVNASLNLTVGYCYRCADFPWLAIWEENRARMDAPWNGSTQARGMEFGTTPLPLGRDEIVKRGALFGQHTARPLKPKEQLHAPWLMFLAVVPSNWHIIDDVRIEPNAILLIAGNEKLDIPAMGIMEFLEEC